MKDFIDDYVMSISSRRRERIYDLLDSASLSKDNIDELVNNVGNIKDFADMQTRKELYGSMIKDTAYVMNFRDMNNRISELFLLSNQVSLIISNNMDTLSSEIKALEDELHSIEKAINTYAFGLSDGGSYDYMFNETFNDETMADFSGTFPIPDRAGGKFIEDEYGVINTANGILSMSAELKRKFWIQGEIITSNCGGYIPRNTEHVDWFTTPPNMADGWKVSVKSVKPIVTSLIKDSKYTGAQVKIGFNLQKPAPCDTLLIEPYSDVPVDIIELKIYGEGSDDQGEDIISEPKVLDRPLALYFPMQNVSRFTIVLSQSTYKRPQIAVDKAEEQYRVMRDKLKRDKEIGRSFIDDTFNRDKRVYKYVFLKTDPHLSQYPDYFQSETPSKKFLTKGNDPKYTFRFKPRDAASNGPWREKDELDSPLRTIIYKQVVPENMHFINERRMYEYGKMINRDNYQFAPNYRPSEPPLHPQSNATTIAKNRKKMTYDYDLGFKSVSIGSGSDVKRSVFMTKVLPAQGDSAAVRIKVSDANYRITNKSLDNTQVTSVEYSISNKSRPVNEADWIPILPVDEYGVVSERLFVSNVGLAMLRFPASSAHSIIVYKNGMKFEYNDEVTYQLDAEKRVTSLRFPAGSNFDLDIITCSYTPSDDVTTIKFSDYNQEQNVLATMYDSYGPGETFKFGTGVDRTITLAQIPFIDYDQIEDTSNLSAYDSQGFSGSYQPISILLEDGSAAINQTNYLGGSQNSLADLASSDMVYYIQSGKTLIFNKILNQSFTVFYQYLPSNLRVRIVMRVNNKSYVSPIVDSFQIKTQIRQADKKRG